MSYPLLFTALRKENGFETTHYDPSVLETGKCDDGGKDAPLTEKDE